MNRYAYQLLLLLCATTLLVGCKESTTTPNEQEVVQGAPATLSLAFASSDMEKVSRVDMGVTKEEEITSIAIFVFDQEGQLVSQTIHETAGTHSSGGGGVLRPNGTDKIMIETTAGYNRKIYAIANYHANLIEGLRSVATQADVNQLVLDMLGNPLFREFGLCKIAYLETTITHQSSVAMLLTYLSAKVTIKVINHCDDLSISGWTADGLPTKSYAVERVVNSNDLTYHDAVDVRSAEHFYSDFSDQNFPFEQEPATPGFGDMAAPKTYGSTFYMYENRRGRRVSKSPPSGWTQPNEATDFRLKSWYAPAHATRIRIWGQTRLNGDPKSFVLNHYLGENNSNDYNVKRGHHYTYTITIKGLNDINIDTNVEQSDLFLEVQPPADLTSIDAHVSTRPFMLYTNHITDPNVTITAEVLQGAGSSQYAEWLDLSTVSLTSQHVRKNSDAAIALWQQEGADNTYVRAKFIPNKKMRAKFGYTPPSSAVVIGSADYPDDDTELPYDKAHHRLCKKITNITTSATSPLTGPIAIFLHLQEYPYASSETYREAIIRFTVHSTGQEPQYTSFAVRQYPPYLFAAAPDGSGEVLLVERSEEYEHTTNSFLPMPLQMGAGMQWGNYNLTAAVDQTTGKTNTLLGVYQSATGNYFDGNNYLMPRYGSLSGGWLSTNLGLINEGVGVTIPTIGGPIHNTPAPEYNNALNNNYNMTAARYCHEKNSDLNGDGQIDPSETFWYLPAVGEVQLFWTYRDAIKLKSDYYWSSTQASSAQAWAISMLHETSAPHLSYNGVPQGLKKEYVTTIGPPRVRCVRRVAATSQVTAVAPAVVRRSDGAVVVDCSNLPNAIYTTQSKLGVVQGNNGAVLAANRQVFKRFEVQSTANAPSNYNALHFGVGKCDWTQGWRLPTQREMLVVFSVRDRLEAIPAFAPFGDTKYWTMFRDLNAHYLVDFDSGLCERGSYFDPAHTFPYRCVRELP